MAMRRSRPASKETEPIRAHKNQNTLERKQRQDAGVASRQPPALLDKVSRMSRNEVSRMSWNLTLQLAIRAELGLDRPEGLSYFTPCSSAE